MVLKAILFNSPGVLNHQTKVAIEAMQTSTYIPAAPINARCHLLGSIQESETLQYRHGVSTSSITASSWHSPPKCLQESPWPNSCSTLVAHIAAASQIQLLAPKNSWNEGSLRLNVSNCTSTSVSAEKNS